MKQNDEENNKKILLEKIKMGKSVAFRGQIDQSLLIFDEIEKEAFKQDFQEIVKLCNDLNLKYNNVKKTIDISKLKLNLRKKLEYANELSGYEKFEEALAILKKIKEPAKKNKFDDIYNKSIKSINEIRNLERKKSS